MFLKTLEMLAIHWKIVNPNLFRHRLKKNAELKKEMKILPNLIKESHYYDLKTILLTCKTIKLQLNCEESYSLDQNFNHSASKLQI